MKKNYFSLSLLVAAAGAMPLTGCIDKDYDLSDIDTNVRVEVDDLVVPVNLDAITLSNILTSTMMMKIVLSKRSATRMQCL